METPALESWTIDPGKWPRLLVVGKHVTPEQADQILVRTANLYGLDCNDIDLDLTAQLVSDEGAGQVCAQWRVTGGEAVAEPLGASLASAEHLTDVEDEAVMAKFVDQMFDVSAERGVTAERLQRAVAAVEAQSA